jgi:hypothetical protein
MNTHHQRITCQRIHVGGKHQRRRPGATAAAEGRDDGQQGLQEQGEQGPARRAKRG